ncbi:MAG: hypothetical protein AAF387_22215 [Pseudomonadota bacterium]
MYRSLIKQLLTTICAVFWLLPTHAYEQNALQAKQTNDAKLSGYTLRGLTHVFVEVDGIHRDFAKYGLEASTLKAQVESELSRHGIVIVDRNALLNSPDVARLRVKINANENQYRFFHYGVKLELAQKIPLSKAGGFIAETTWTSGQTGVIMPMDLRRLGAYANDLVTIFLKDYRAQNPKVATLR